MRLPNAVALTAALGVLSGAAAATGVLMSGGAQPGSHLARDRTPGAARGPLHAAGPAPGPTSTTSSSPTTSTSTTTSTTSTTSTSAPTTGAGGPGDHGPITSPPLPPPGPGFVAGLVTAVGDSVMIDYEQPLAQDIPGIEITAAVSRQWTQGEAVLAALKAEGRLGAVVIVALGTNGPITATSFDAMMAILAGASRVVFVNVHVDRAWQDPNNSVLASGAARFGRTVVADWNALADENPGWLYPATGTHLPPGGTGAQALAALVAQAA